MSTQNQIHTSSSLDGRESIQSILNPADIYMAQITKHFLEQRVFVCVCVSAWMH